MVFSDRFSDASVVRRADGWVSAWVRDQYVLMGGRTGVYIGVTSTGGRIFELLERPITIRELCTNLSEEYEVSPAEARPGVLTFLQEMLLKKAICVEP